MSNSVITKDRVSGSDSQNSPQRGCLDAGRLTPAGMKHVAANCRRLNGRASELAEKPSHRLSTRHRLAAAFLLGASVTLTAMAATAKSAPECGAIYTVSRGDTLFKIAKQAYGDGWQFKQVFAANRDLLKDIESIEIGDQILIPCRDGTGPHTRQEAVAQGLIAGPGSDPATTASMEPESGPATDAAGPSDELTAEAAFQKAAQVVRRLPLPGQALVSATRLVRDAVAENAENATGLPAPDKAIRLLTGSGRAPYADEAAPTGGTATDLILRAMRKGAPGQEISLAFINHWSAHMDVLLPGGAFDAGFPWYKPDCARIETLGDVARRLCTDYEFSRPLVEVSTSFYARAGDGAVDARSYADLSATRLCRPRASAWTSMEQNNAALQGFTVEITETAAQCLVKLQTGQVDVAAMAGKLGDAEILRLGLDQDVVKIHAIASSRSLHAIVHKSNPMGQEYLEMIDRGLAEIMASGEWFEVVASHRGGQASRTN